jgi:hypothetical protein
MSSVPSSSELKLTPFRGRRLYDRLTATRYSHGRSESSGSRRSIARWARANVSTTISSAAEGSFVIARPRR